MVLSWILPTSNCFGQEDSKSYDYYFEQAREKAYKDKNYSLSKVLIRKAISIDETREAKIYLIRLHHWSREFAPGLKLVHELLKLNPEDLEVYELGINLLEEEEKFEESLALVIKALQVDEYNPNMLYRKAYCLYSLKRYKECRAMLKVVMKESPDHIKAAKLVKQIQVQIKDYFVAINYTKYFNQSNEFSTNYYNLSAGSKNGDLTLIGSLDYLKGYKRVGHQFGLEVYKVFDKTTYISVYGTYSNSIQFPTYRLNATFLKYLNKGFETEFNINYLSVAESSVRLFSTGLNKYLGNALFSAKAIFNEINNVVNLNYKFGYRQYFGTSHDYLAVSFGNITRNEIFDSNQDFFLNQSFIELKGQLLLKGAIILSGSISKNISKVDNRRYLFHSGIKYKF